MREPRCQHRTLQDDRHQTGAAATGAQHGPVWLRHVEQADVARSQRRLAPARAEPHFAFDAEGDVIVIEATACDVGGGPVVFQVGGACIDQQRVAGHHRCGRDVEIVLVGERNDIADVDGHRTQLPQRARPALGVVRQHEFVHRRLVRITPRRGKTASTGYSKTGGTPTSPQHVAIQK